MIKIIGTAIFAHILFSITIDTIKNTNAAIKHISHRRDKILTGFCLKNARSIPYLESST